MTGVQTCALPIFRLVSYPVEHPALKRAVEVVLDGVSLARIADFWKAEYGITTAELVNRSVQTMIVDSLIIGRG